MSTLGDKIKTIRIAKHLTQTEVAEKLNVSRSAISHWEANTKKPTFDNINEFAKIVGVTLDYFSDDSQERTLFQLLAQLENVFNAADIGEADKDKAYQDIMKIYLKSKESAPSDKKEGSRKEDIIGD